MDTSGLFLVTVYKAGKVRASMKLITDPGGFFKTTQERAVSEGRAGAIFFSDEGVPATYKVWECKEVASGSSEG